MPLADLSLVTTTLLALLKARVDPSWAKLVAPGGPAITYTGVTSDALTGSLALGMFLYHAVEDAHFKNQASQYHDQPPVRFTPMGLQLHYQLVAHAQDQGHPDTAVANSQRLFGLALKTLHDYPTLNRTTQIGGGSLFTGSLVGTDNVFRITLKNTPPSEAASFWTSGTQYVRLAAYYEVCVAFLEPDRPQRRTGRVLRYGVDVFVNGAPRLDASRSNVRFRLPGETSDRSVEISPGEAAVGETIAFDGVDLNGDRTSLLVSGPGWAEGVEVGFDWGVVSGTDTIVAQVQPKAGSHDILPGVYSAAAIATRNRLLPDGRTRAFAQSSNQVPFTVAPKITNPPYNAVAVAVGQTLTVTGGIFQNAGVPPENVRVIVGPEPVPLETGGALTAGHFKILNATQLSIMFPVPLLNSGEVHPLRIIVNGAENAPRWVKVP